MQIGDFPFDAGHNPGVPRRDRDGRRTGSRRRKSWLALSVVGLLVHPPEESFGGLERVTEGIVGMKL
jgi:hypothetical protein